MRHQKIFTFIYSLILTLTICFSGLGQVEAAGSATLSLTPASGSYRVGDTVTVTVQENSGTDAVNAVQADLNYSGTLQHVSTNLSSSAFTLVGTNTAGGGSVKLGLASTTNRTGQQTVAVVTFRAISAGTSTISFAGTSAIVRASDVFNVLGPTSGATYTISGNTTTPTPTPTAKPTGTTTTTTTTKPPTTSTSTSNTTSPTSSTTNSSPTNTTTSPSTPSGVQGASTDRYMVAIKVLDENNKIVVGAKVTFDGGMVAISDATGVASFVNVPAGKHTFKTTINGKEKSQVIDVKGVSTSIPEEYSLQLSKESLLQANKNYIALAVGVFVVLIIIYALWRKYRTPPGDHHMDGAPIIGGTGLPPAGPGMMPPTNGPTIGNVIGPNAINHSDASIQDNQNIGV